MLIFKECTCCKNPWYSREDFLGDSKLDFVGYQVNFGDLELGYFLFNHLSCQSTIAVHAGLFKDLYDGQVFSERKTNSEKCPGYCTDREALDLCDATQGATAQLRPQRDPAGKRTSMGRGCAGTPWDVRVVRDHGLYCVSGAMSE